MKTTKTILLAAILVFATQLSFGQQFLNVKADLNKPDKHKIELRKKGHERPSKVIIVKPKLEKRKVVKKQIQPKKQKVVLKKKKVVQPIVKKRK